MAEASQRNLDFPSSLLRAGARRTQPRQRNGNRWARQATSSFRRGVTDGRVSVIVLLAWEDEDVRVAVVERTEGYKVEQGQVNRRKWVAWHCKNDPPFRLVYQ